MISKVEQASNEKIKLIHPSWVYDESTQSYIPPFSMPADGKEYVWDEKSINWYEINSYYQSMANPIA